MKIALWLVLVLVLAGASMLAPHDPNAQNRDAALTAPSARHWFGTDDYGRDVFARTLAGGRWSLAVGGAATVAVLLVASLLGGLAGFAGGWVDALLMWAADLVLTVPWLFLVIAARAAFPPELSPRASAALLITLIATVSWPRPARLIRNVVLAERRRDYVAAALGFGVSPVAAYANHVLPATASVLVTQATLLFPRLVLVEMTLSFLGAGAAEPDPSWGGLLVPLRQAYLLREQWWLALPAGCMVLFFVVAARLTPRQEM